jgi:hypothetical protein
VRWVATRKRKPRQKNGKRSKKRRKSKRKATTTRRRRLTVCSFASGTARRQIVAHNFVESTTSFFHGLLE